MEPIKQQFRFNKMYFVVSDNDDKVIKGIFDDIIVRNADVDRHNLIEPEYISVHSKDQFKNSMKKIRKDCKTKAILPYLHIQCHGNREYLKLTSNAKIGYNDLNQLITGINIACRNNLFISMSSCYGGHFAKQLTKILGTVRNIKQAFPAPFFGLIGPSHDINDGEIEEKFLTYFEAIFDTMNFNKVIESMNKNYPGPSNPFLYTTCINVLSEFFNSVASHVLQNRIFKNKIHFDAKLIKIAQQTFKETGILPDGNHLNSLSHLILNKNFFIQMFRDIQDRYYMLDPYPENKDRFPEINDIHYWDEMITKFRIS